MGVKCVHFHIRVNAHDWNMASCWSLFAGENLSFSLPVHLSVSRRRGGGVLMLSQSEKRLAKDLRRLRMVSAFTSSWLRLARGAGVSGMLKVLVRDWDLL